MTEYVNITFDLSRAAAAYLAASLPSELAPTPFVEAELLNLKNTIANTLEPGRPVPMFAPRSNADLL